MSGRGGIGRRVALRSLWGTPVKVQVFSIAPIKKTVVKHNGFLYNENPIKKGVSEMRQIQDEYEKAMAVLNDLAKDYLIWVQDDLKKLSDTYEAALKTKGAMRTDLIVQDLFRTVHDMKGQGATFGYDLITDIGNHLCRYIERFDVFEDAQMNAIKTHIDALNEIIQKQLIGAGGERGQELKTLVEAF